MGKPLPKPESTNPRGIPQAPFLNSVDEYVNDLDEATTLLGQLKEMMQKYQLMEMATRNRRKTLAGTLPNLKETSKAVEFLQQQEKDFEMQYALNETVYAKAVIPPAKTVWLWLGANVMLEFPLNEALELTYQKIGDAEKGLAECNEDLEFLKENITTMEVNTARTINWQVARRKITAEQATATA